MSIFNPYLFIGETVAGSVGGAPLSTDSSGDLVSGISFIEVTATASATSTTTDVALLTNTPVAGTYLVIFSADFNSATSGVVVSISLYIGGVQKADSLRKFMPFAGGTLTAGSQRTQSGTQGFVTVNGSQAIDLRWSSSTAGSTTAARTMNLIRLL